jgi:hypothetical protein
MKKLIALVAIVVFCAVLVNAENIPNPFKFGVSAGFTMKTDNAYSAQTIDAKSPITSLWDATNTANAGGKIGSAYLEYNVAGNISTAVKIWSTSFNFAGRLRQWDAKSSKNEVRFLFLWGNKFSIVKDYLDLNVDLGYNIDNNANFKQGSWYEPNNDNILMALITKGKSVTSLIPTGTIGIGGKVGNSGFKWGLSETAILQLNSDFYKDNNPMALNINPFAVSATGTVSMNTAPANGSDPQRDNLGSIIDSIALQGKIDLQFEFFHYFAPANVTCNIKAPVTVGVFMPYCNFMEISKEITIDTTPGLEFNVMGIQLFLGARSRTQFYYNTASPMDGSNGSMWSHDGQVILTNSGALATTTPKDLAPDHHQAWWRGGPQVKFTLGKDWLTFTADWQGYFYAGAATYDNDNLTNGGKNAGLGAGTGMKNEFNIGCSMKL